MRKVHLADGRVLTFPDETTDEVMQQTAQRVLSDAVEDAPAPEESTFRPGLFDPVKQVGGQFLDAAVENIAEPINEGLYDALAAPARLTNLAITGAEKLTGLDLPKFDTQAPRDVLVEKGALPPEDEVATGFVPRSLRILSGSVVPGGALMTRAARLKQLEQSGALALTSSGQRGVVDSLARASAANPGLNLAVDTGASFAAGFGGESAEAVGFSQSGQLIAEMLFGIGAPLAILSRAGIASSGTGRLRGRSKRAATKSMRETIADEAIPENQLPNESLIQRGINKVGAKLGVEDKFASQRAANEELVNDRAIELASKIDPESSMPPAIQTGDDRLIAIQNFMLKGNDGLEARYKSLVDDAMVEMETNLTVGANNKPREILQQRADRIGEIFDDAITVASSRMKAKFDELGTDITPRRASEIAREEADKVEVALRGKETEAWDSVNQDGSGAFAVTQKALDDIVATRSEISVELLDAKILKRIRNMKNPKFKDIHALRKVVDGKINSALKGDDPNREVADLYGQLRKSLTKDMALAAPEATNAIAISRELGKRFRDGPVGRLYTRGIVGGDTMQSILDSRTPVTNYKAFLSADPAAKPRIEEFLRSQYDQQVLNGGKFNRKRHNAFVGKLERNGLSEEFPELMRNVEDASYLTNRVRTLQGRKQARDESRRSAVNTYLDADVGHEMAAVITSKNPTKMARNLFNKVRADSEAVEGLHASFNQEMFSSARKLMPNGDWTVDGKKLVRLIDENADIARALGMDNAAITRMRAEAKMMAMATNPQAASQNIVGGNALLTKFGVTLLGAKFGAKVAQGGIGSGIKMAQEGASLFNRLATRFTKGTVVGLLQEAQLNPTLYREILLADVTDAKQLRRAIKLSEEWLAGATTQAIDDREKLKPGSANAGVTEQLNLGAQ